MIQKVVLVFEKRPVAVSLMVMVVNLLLMVAATLVQYKSHLNFEPIYMLLEAALYTSITSAFWFSARLDQIKFLSRFNVSRKSVIVVSFLVSLTTFCSIKIGMKAVMAAYDLMLVSQADRYHLLSPAFVDDLINKKIAAEKVWWP